MAWRASHPNKLGFHIRASYVSFRSEPVSPDLFAYLRSALAP